MLIPMSTGASSGSGGFVAEVTTDVFFTLLERQEEPVVFHREAGWPSQHTYLTWWRGVYFFFKQREAMDLSTRAEVIDVENIYSSLDYLG